MADWNILIASSEQGALELLLGHSCLFLKELIEELRTIDTFLVRDLALRQVCATRLLLVHKVSILKGSSCMIGCFLSSAILNVLIEGNLSKPDVDRWNGI